MPEHDETAFTAKLTALTAAAQTASGAPETVAATLEANFPALTSRKLTDLQIEKIASDLIQASKQKDDTPHTQA